MNRTEENLHAVLLDQIDASVIVTDMSGNVISWNSGAEALYGWRSDEAVGRNARELIVPAQTDPAKKLVEELRQSGRWDGELLVHRKDGSLFTAYVRNRLILDEDGNASAIVGVAVDISARVAAETELLQSRNYAQAVTECMGEGLVTIDLAGRITYVNPTAEAMLEWPAGELLGHMLEAVIHPAGIDGLPSAFEQTAIASVLTHQQTLRADEDVFLTRGAREIRVSYTAAPFHAEEKLQGCVVIFQDVSERTAREAEVARHAATLECLDRVEAAIMEDRFVLHAQPIVDLRSGETVQHELLLRMREPDGRIAAPGEFLPVAEQYALIGEIDWWVIKQATALAGAGCQVELNISARSVGDLDVLEHIERCIQECQVAPGMMVFEITETAIVEEEEEARNFARRLHALGCKIALDDFGTGYGTLTYLKQIPLDFLKLDIEFVRDLVSNSASRHVVKAVLALAHDFQLKTVAEGVEDAQTLALLCELGVDFAQGYHLARPEPFTDRPGDRSTPVKMSARPPARPGRRHLSPAGRHRARRRLKAPSHQIASVAPPSGPPAAA